MPYTKDDLVKQANEFRLRIKLLLDLKKDVGDCIDDACTRWMEELSKMEKAAQLADTVAIRRMTQKLRNARQVIKNYEEALERVRQVYEDEDIGMDDGASNYAAPTLTSMMRQSDQSAAFDRMQLMQPRPAVAADRSPIQDLWGAADANASGDNGAAAVMNTTEPFSSHSTPRSTGRVDDLLCLAPSFNMEATSVNGHDDGLISFEPTVTETRRGQAGQPDGLHNGREEVVHPMVAPTATNTNSSLSEFGRDSRKTDPVAPSGLGVPVNDVPLESSVEIVCMAPPVPEPSLVAERTSTQQRSPVNSQHQNAEVLQPAASAAVEASAADISGDYRKHIVSKGSGNPDDGCQRAVGLSQSKPVMCTLSHVESPSFFWVRLFTSNLDSFEDEMNCDLDTEKSAISNPQVGDYCAAPAEADEDMHRAKILEIKDNSLGTPFAKILYIDTGKVDWVATKALLELPRRYRHYLRQAFPCALADLVPAGDRWNDDVINTFRELCSDNENFDLQVTSLNEEESPDIHTVTLQRVKKGEESKNETILIALIKSAIGKVRRAERMVPMVAFEKEGGEPFGGLNPPDDTEGWRCTVRMLECEVAEEAEEVEEPMARDAEREALRLSMVDRVGSSVTPGELSQVLLSNVLDNSGHVYFRVCNVLSPNNFYVQLFDRNGNNERMDALTMEMNTFYSNPINQVMLPRMCANQSAAAFFTIDGVSAYRRVMIKDWQMPFGAETSNRDIRVYSTVTVIFVDYGHCEKVQGKDVFMLDRRFCHIPAQAAYCQLYGCRPRVSTPDGFWDQNSVDVFKELTMSGKPLMKGLVCSDKQPFEMVVYRLEPSGEWTCINTRMVDSNLAIGEIDFS